MNVGDGAIFVAKVFGACCAVMFLLAAAIAISKRRRTRNRLRSSFSQMGAPEGPLAPDGGGAAPEAAVAGNDGRNGNLDLEMFPVARPAPTYDAAVWTSAGAEAPPRYSAFAAGKGSY